MTLQRKVQGDPVLAEFLERHGVKPGPSRIIGTDWIATALNRERLGQRRIVDLSCRHKAVTRNRSSMTCPRCVELIREGLDYEGWISGRVHPYDDLVWKDDPCRSFHEPAGAEGVIPDEGEEAGADPRR